MRGRKSSASIGNGSPFSDSQLESIRRHERVHDIINGKIKPEPDEHDGIMWWYAGGKNVDWPWFRDATAAVAANKKKHSIFGPTWSEFPHNVADVEAVIRWRAVNPRG